MVSLQLLLSVLGIFGDALNAGPEGMGPCHPFLIFPSVTSMPSYASSPLASLPKTRVMGGCCGGFLYHSSTLVFSSWGKGRYNKDGSQLFLRPRILVI